MPVTPVQAWKTDSGTCFENKVAAYDAEVHGLYASLPVVGRRGFTVTEFEKLTAEVKGWLARAEGLLAEAAEEKTYWLTDLRKLAGEVKGWVRKAEILREQMKGEKDADVARQVK